MEELTAFQMIEIMERFGYKCALTGSRSVHVDHWFPRKHGGLTDFRNCYPLDATLNLRKNAENPFTFFERDDIRSQFTKEKFDDLVFWLALNNGMTVEEFRNVTYKIYDEPSQIE